MSTFLVWQGPTGEPNNPWLEQDWWVGFCVEVARDIPDLPFFFFFCLFFPFFCPALVRSCSVGVQGIVREARDVSPWASWGAIDVRPVGMVHEIRFE
jgi:hypothetical protein